MKTIFSTKMINTGGRDGVSAAPDNSFVLKIARPQNSVPDSTNPEQLFAAGYSACFHSALKLVMQQANIEAESTVSVNVSLYERAAFDFIIGAEIEGHIEGISLDQAQALLDKAHEVCPYSKATRGNIEVTVKAV